MTNHAQAVDYEGGTHDAQFAHAILLAHLADAIFAAHLAFTIRQQANRKSVLVAKFRMAQTIIAADAKYHTILAGELFLVIAKVYGFKRAEWRIVPRIKKQYSMLPATQR